jgi:3-phosphoshikimate 1-carboxyvinyltransferase
MKGRLAQRPLSPLWEEMERMGCQLSRPSESTILCQGRLSPGTYNIAGNISSQFITGLLLAFALMDGDSDLRISGKLESLPYISMTQAAMQLFGVNTEDFRVNGVGRFKTPGTVTVEGDWSNGAFFLSAKALGSSLTVTNLDIHSSQGDRAIADILANIDNCPTVDAADIPDLVPILAVIGGAKKGISFTNIRRLRLKESDRVATVCAMLEKLGAHTEATENTLTVSPAPYGSCTIDAAGDHRIAMAAAIAATVASGPITILGAQCVAKSYPAFWNDYKKLGGCYEQHLR